VPVFVNNLYFFNNYLELPLFEHFLGFLYDSNDDGLTMLIIRSLPPRRTVSRIEKQITEMEKGL
jgi:hypothetical protein